MALGGWTPLPLLSVGKEQIEEAPHPWTTSATFPNRKYECLGGGVGEGVKGMCSGVFRNLERGIRAPWVHFRCTFSKVLKF